MNKREFDTIAGVIRDRKHNVQYLGELGWSKREREIAQATLEDLQLFMEMELQATYPKTFHRDKFMQACKLDK